jgi:hypothetical protein
MQMAFGGSAVGPVNSCKTALPSETSLKPHERFFIPNYHFYWNDQFPGRKDRTAVAMRKGISPNHGYLPPLASIEVTGFCIPIGNSEVLLAADYHQAMPGMMQTSLSS